MLSRGGIFIIKIVAMKKYIVHLLLISTGFVFAQEIENDSLLAYQNLEEVIVVSKARFKNEKQYKPLSSVDEYLENSGKVSMIKRGNYAWEASLNNMLSERLSITIDGMQIFGACTDKMDPITSYVDISNLDKITVSSGQHGTQNGATIGGAIDLKIQKNSFGNEDLNIGIDTGYESNSSTKIASGELNYSNKKIVLNTDASYRKATNYYAGNNQEVLFSQYEKYNISSSLGFKTGNKSSITGSIIYDQANNVGYPALTMDVSLAKALISAVAYKIDSLNPIINTWETKAYYNTITHVMDDTKRPDVAIHMDMPGWSDTFGFYSKAQMQKNKHNLLFNLNGYYNKSLAEMTMYPNNQNENLMFMLTWPDVRTFYSGFYAEDHLKLKNNWSFLLNGRIGFQNATVANDFGLHSLQIFYPELKKTTTRILSSLSSKISKKVNNTTFTVGFGYGERAPSVTEAYGFYLYNSFDNYDYVGNPNLKNEKSFESNLGIQYKAKHFTLNTEASYFYIKDYIIGKTNPDLTQMTINADGVRIYTGLNYATIFNTSVKASYKIVPRFSVSGLLSYGLGKDHQGNNLPLIKPFSYRFDLHYKKDFWDSEISLNGSDSQNNFSSYYGENKTGAYTIVNLSSSYSFHFNQTKLFLKAGLENIFDKHYSTYSDWNNIPRPGRNLFINASYIIN